MPTAIRLDADRRDCGVSDGSLADLSESWNFSGKQSDLEAKPSSEVRLPEDVGSFLLNIRTLLALALVLIAGAYPASPSRVMAQPPQAAASSGVYLPVLGSEMVSVDPYATVQPGTAWPWTGSVGWPATVPVIPSAEVLRDRLYLRTEYLRWKGEGMNVPVLVSGSSDGTPLADAAVLGEPNTTVLFGGSEINDESVGGIRTRGGFWIRQDATVGLEAEYFGLEDQRSSFATASDGSVILGIPYFDIVNGTEAAQLVSYPGEVSGAVQVAGQSELRSYLINGRIALVPPGVMSIDGPADRVDWILGYRHLDLDDTLTIAHQIESLTVASTGRSAVDSFSTSNDFDGLQLGFVHEAIFRRVWIESLLRVAIGSNQQRVSIAGSTSDTDAGVTTEYSGGLFAQRTNIGTWERDQFTMIPEVGLTLGVRLTDCLHATVGYSLIYFPNVVRAGDQIDRDLNPNLFPPEASPFSGAGRPQFTFVEDNYWAQGLSVGGELRF